MLKISEPQQFPQTETPAGELWEAPESGNGGKTPKADRMRDGVRNYVCK